MPLGGCRFHDHLSEDFEDAKHPKSIYWDRFLGETRDERNTYAEYRRSHPEVSWQQFNFSALANAQKLATDKLAGLPLTSRIVLHSGYAPAVPDGDRSKIEPCRQYVQSQLETLRKDDYNFLLESIVLWGEQEDHSQLRMIHYGFGGIPEDMQMLLGEEIAGEQGTILLDFTHLGVNANQMHEHPEWFAHPRSYSRLVEDFLKMRGVSNFTHYSGDNPFLWAAHDWKLSEQPKNEVVAEALQELNRRFGAEGKDVYVALEIWFHGKELYRKEVESFCEKYIR